MPFYERGAVRIHYQEVGSGFPLLLIPGGGLNSSLASWQTASPFDPMDRYRNDFRCICADLRNANPGQSSGPLEIDRPWDAYTDDQLGLMDHLGIGKFLVMGFCIGGPMIHNLIRRAPERVVAAAMLQPSGFRPEIPDLFYQNNIKGWGPALCARRPDVTMAMVHDFLTSMYTSAPTSCSPCRATSCGRSGRRCGSLPTTCRRIPTRWPWRWPASPPRAEVTIYPWKGLAGPHRRGRRPRAALPQGARGGPSLGARGGPASLTLSSRPAASPSPRSPCRGRRRRGRSRGA
jgi:pimeloyl-ACP methyl ester carboxylesterase